MTDAAKEKGLCVEGVRPLCVPTFSATFPGASGVIITRMLLYLGAVLPCTAGILDSHWLNEPSQVVKYPRLFAYDDFVFMMDWLGIRRRTGKNRHYCYPVSDTDPVAFHPEIARQVDDWYECKTIRARKAARRKMISNPN